MKRNRSPWTPIEFLEPRIAPAGVIDIVTQNGNAVIKVLGNTDTVQDLDLVGSIQGNLLLTGNDGETFRLNGVPTSGPVELAGIVGSVAIDLGKNGDTLDISGVFLGGTLTLKMGDGENTTSIINSTVGAINYIGGTGQDSVTFSGASFDAAGKVNLKLGSGANTLAFNALEARVGGDFVYTGGSGSDVVSGTTDALTIGGNMTFKGSTGLNTLTFDSDAMIVGKNLTFVSGVNQTGTSGLILNGTDLLRVGGNFSYINPTGQQNLALSSASSLEISGSVSIKAGPAQDMTASFGSGGSFSSGKINVVGKADHMTLSISAQQVSIEDGIKATGLRGFVLNSPGIVSGSVSITAGAAGIGLVADAEELTITGKTNLKTVAAVGQNTATILTNVRFLDNFNANLSAGTNAFTANNITAFGTFTIASKSSGDSVLIETNDLPGISTFYKAVTINLGPGFDLLTVGANTESQRVYAYSTFKVLGGITDNEREAISLENGNVFLIEPTIS